ncbi:hypothetical protein [Oryzomonas rubra]|uniref:Uncharacterized protein n=1 Tax=Oryzomonas rubra TaxID=2509454 RepID=A0A5A9X6Z8_9BACT|nr:hypothetical protein [Oryzomonas rubra]KAA0888740.1 hypothetical protein ET418_15280 [Oryzomonas rubra]
MKATIRHNLSPEELTKSLSALAESEGIGEELQKALRKTATCDETPKVPRQVAVRQLYEMMCREFQRAADDCERYAEMISGSDRPRQQGEAA